MSWTYIDFEFPLCNASNDRMHSSMHLTVTDIFELLQFGLIVICRASPVENLPLSDCQNCIACSIQLFQLELHISWTSSKRIQIYLFWVVQSFQFLHNVDLPSFFLSINLSNILLCEVQRPSIFSNEILLCEVFFLC